jgi:hypothetical protein
MPSPTSSEPKPDSGKTPVLEHVTGAHKLLKTLQKRVGEHPELGEAITELEMALSILAVQTAGLL